MSLSQLPTHPHPVFAGGEAPAKVKALLTKNGSKVTTLDEITLYLYQSDAPELRTRVGQLMTRMVNKGTAHRFARGKFLSPTYAPKTKTKTKLTKRELEAGDLLEFLGSWNNSLVFKNLETNLLHVYKEVKK